MAEGAGAWPLACVPGRAPWMHQEESLPENRLVAAKGDGEEEGSIGSLGLADANWHI